jgi:hypothetical protein
MKAIPITAVQQGESECQQSAERWNADEASMKGRSHKEGAY